MPNQFTNLCQSGAYSILSLEMDKLLKRYEVEFDKDPYELARRHGVKEGAENFCQDLKDLIEAYAKK